MSGTGPQSIADYLAKVPSENANKPKFITMLRAILGPLQQLQTFLADLPAQFDLDNAIGVQLDQVGQWIGRTRYLQAPISGVYFAWDTAGLGWDQGRWQGPFDPSFGIITLGDDEYRLVLRLKILLNTWNGENIDAVGNEVITDAIQAILDLEGATGTLIFFLDNQDMTMTLGMSGVLPGPVVVALFNDGYFDFKPAGVRIRREVTTISGEPIFGFDADGPYIGGWDHGTWASVTEA